MSKQKTILRTFGLTGICMYSGNVVHAEFSPAEPDTGVCFVTPEGSVKATLENAVPSRRSIMLRDPESGAEIINVEHVLATLYAFGVDNVSIDVERINARQHVLRGKYSKAAFVAYHSYRGFKEMGCKIPEVYPNIPGEESFLSDVLHASCLVEQDAEREVIRLDRKFMTPNLSFYPMPERDGLYMEATTNYPMIGWQKYGCQIELEVYRKELAGSRRYAHYMQPFVNVLGKTAASYLSRFIAQFAFPTFGFGHGCNPENVFVPCRSLEDWKACEKYDSEIARHTIVDRLGAIALLGKRLEGVWCDMEFSNHENDVLVLREFKKELEKDKTISRNNQPRVGIDRI